MAVFGSLFFNRTLKQFLACKDLKSPKGQALVEKIQLNAKDSLEKILETIPSTRKPHSDVLKQICQQYLQSDSERFLDNLDNDSTQVRSAAVNLLGTSQQISPAKLFKRLHDDPAARSEIIEILSIQQANLAPELFVKNALKLDKEYALRLLEMARNNAARTDMSALVIDTDTLENPDIKIQLIRFLGAVDQPAAAEIVCRFVGDKSRIVNMEALKNLKKMQSEFDPTSLVEKMPQMSADDIAAVLEIFRQKITQHSLPRLASLMTSKNDEIRQQVAQIVRDKITSESLQEFLLELDKSEWWGKEQAVKCLIESGGEQLAQAASKLTDHHNEFVRNTATQLSAGYSSDHGDLTEITKSLFHADWQVRERAIAKIGKSGDKSALPKLAKVLEMHPESSLSVLKAIAELGFSKGLEIALKCLQKKEAAIQREALLTMGAIVSSRHADQIRSGIIKSVPKLQATVRDTALDVINDITNKFNLPKLNMDDEAMFETRLIKIEENRAAMPGAQLTQETEVIKIDKTEVVSFQHIEELKPGDYWMDRFRITKEIGRGAMGRVMLVDDEVVGETLILKFMHPELTADANSRERFLRELKYARKISHPNVIRIHDFMVKEGISAISMEYFESFGLDALIKGQRLKTVEETLHILYQVSDGMYAAHQQDVIHRDLKPSNILVNDKRLAKVVDFGIASASSEKEVTLTKTGMIIGTPAYLSPERARGLEADHRSDIYALGIIAYAMFNGALPYKGEPISLLFQHIEGKATPLHRLDKGIPIGVSMLVEKMMAVDIDQRFQTMQDVRDTIKHLK
jgi:serine/threonine-protein kinase